MAKINVPLLAIFTVENPGEPHVHKIMVRTKDGQIHDIAHMVSGYEGVDRGLFMAGVDENPDDYVKVWIHKAVVDEELFNPLAGAEDDEPVDNSGLPDDALA